MNTAHNGNSKGNNARDSERAALGYGGLTLGQIRWAQGHDWFNGWYAEGGKLCVTVTEVSSDAAGVYVRTLEFSNYAELRAWAGY